MRNSAHDSICACSHDEVAAAVLHRYAEATRIAEGVTERALARLASSLSQPCHVAVNPSSRPRSGVVELIVGGQGPIEGAQILDERFGLAADLVLTTTEVRGVLSQFGGQDQLGEGAYLAGVEVEEDDTGIDVVVRVRPERTNELASRTDKERPARPVRSPARRSGQGEARPGVVPASAGPCGGHPQLRLEGLATPAAA